MEKKLLKISMSVAILFVGIGLGYYYIYFLPIKDTKSFVFDKNKECSNYSAGILEDFKKWNYEFRPNRYPEQVETHKMLLESIFYSQMLNTCISNILSCDTTIDDALSVSHIFKDLLTGNTIWSVTNNLRYGKYSFDKKSNEELGLEIKSVEATYQKKVKELYGNAYNNMSDFEIPSYSSCL